MKRRMIAGLVLSAALALAAEQKAKSPEALLGAAIHQEEAEGNLEAAIAAYKKFLAQHGSNRALAAKAQLHLGLCYEKLGSPEARKAYERVLSEYADQPEIAAQARSRLMAMPQPAPSSREPATRRVWAGPGVDNTGAPSADGRLLSFTDWATGDLALRDLTAGTQRRLTAKGGWEQSGDYAFKSRISPDGKQVAYAWQKQSSIELHLIAIEGGGPGVLYSNPEVSYLEPADWSPDGKRVLTALNTRSRTVQIALISVADGSAKVLKTLPWGSLGRMAFAPDGRYIAYDFQPKEDSPNRSIMLLSSDGSREIALSENPAREEVFGWSPDGKALLFASDRTGSRELWVIAVAGGRAQGLPELVRRDIGRIQPLGLTRKGSLYYLVGTGTSEVYTASWDWKTGKVLAQPKPVGRRLLGVNRDPVWSPDGKNLAYISHSGTRGSEFITIFSVESGEERQVSPRLSRINRLSCWSFDGGSVLVMGFDQKKREGAYKIDVHTAEVQPLVQAQSGETIFQPEWLPGDKAIVYYRRDDGPQPSHLVVRDLESGAERELPSRAENSGFIATSVSPDGRLLAFVTNADNVRTLRVIPVTGGIPRELLRINDPAVRIRLCAWTPDSSQVIFTTHRRAGLQIINNELWRIPANGGERYRLPADELRGVELHFHPDGRQIAFSRSQGNLEIWVMENLFATPAATASR